MGGEKIPIQEGEYPIGVVASYRHHDYVDIRFEREAMKFAGRSFGR